MIARRLTAEKSLIQKSAEELKNLKNQKNKKKKAEKKK